MPWHNRELFQFMLLVLCVPIQYYLSGYFDKESRSEILISTIKSIEEFKDKLFDSSYWLLKWNSLTFFDSAGQ